MNTTNIIQLNCLVPAVPMRLQAVNLIVIALDSTLATRLHGERPALVQRFNLSLNGPFLLILAVQKLGETADRILKALLHEI